MPGSRVNDQAAAQDDFLEALLDDDPEQLYHQAPCGYLSTTPDGAIIKVNRTFLTWTGYTEEDLVGARTFAELLTAGGRIYHETHYAPLLRMQGRVREIAVDLKTADGSRLPILLNAVLERFPNGDPRVVRLAVFDATERRKYERELLGAKERAEVSEARATALAKTLQQTLIPPALPTIEGIDVAAAYRAAGSGGEVGGDFYDIFQVDEENWIVALGDVCGKGAEAAVVTALARYTIRALAVQTLTPSEILDRLNVALLTQRVDRYCTVAILALRRAGAGWNVTVSLGGHPQPVLHDPETGPRFVGQAGSLVGVLDTAAWVDSQIQLRAGQSLFLYTDGVTEARRGHDFYGDERLRQTVGRYGGSAAELVDGVVADVLAFQGSSPRDDIAVVSLGVPA